MAIIIEEKTNGNGLVNFISWLVILAIIGAGVYYIFFKQPEFVEFTVSTSFKNIQQLSQISINSDQLTNNEQFKSLKPYITIPSPQNIGRTNPFLGF